tara:strand:- start:1459 stop:2595 length:1137 start_codon:yes stop_codon:yes gene_type:complete
MFVIVGILSFINNCSDNTIVEKNHSSAVIKIALLLPSESQSKQTNKLSKYFINSARLALQDLDHLNFTLSVYPTSGDPARAVHAAEEAVERGTQVIVGPLYSAETTAVGKALKNNKVKIISLSNDPKVAGQNVFIMGTTFQTSANRLVEFALIRGFNRIAIIGPEGKFGQDAIIAAKESIRKNRATLTTVSLYPLTFKGIQSSASTIYQELVQSNSNAVIFTDSPTRGLGFISEQLHQFYHNDNKEPPQFMGLTRWDSSKQILNESSLNNGWFIVPDQRFKKKFNDRYKKTFGSNPIDISSLSYDAIALIGAIIERSSSADPFYKFHKKYFLDENGFLGVNGIFRFFPNGNNEREVSVAEVKSGAFTVIDQAKTSFTK